METGHHPYSNDFFLHRIRIQLHRYIESATIEKLSRKKLERGKNVTMDFQASDSLYSFMLISSRYNLNVKQSLSY